MFTTSKLTVVIMNWKRPQNVRKFAHDYATHDRVDKVIVVNNAEYLPAPRWEDSLQLFSATDDDVRAKLIQINPTEDLGLASRFAAGALARTDHVLIVDDDIELPDMTVTALHDEFLRTDAGAVGIFGRCPDRHGNYNCKTHHGKVDIVLTRAVITAPAICAEACWRSVAMGRALGGEPFGNGEDIVMSYTARRATGQLNRAFNLPYRNVGYDDQHAISVRYPGHEAHRTKVVEWCRKNITGAQ